jgi:macrolide transport system ATP-binding/permease protein
MDTLMRDVRYAFRTIGKNPGFALVTVISLALGIGANTTIYSWVKGLLVRPLPGVSRIEQLSVLYERSRSGAWNNTSYPDFVDFRDAVASKADVVAYNMQTAGLDAGDRTDRVWAESVSANYFSALGVKLILGRGFVPEEDLKPGGAPVVVLSHDLWAGRFNSDPAIIGKTLSLNRHAFTVAGVASRDFHGSFVSLSTDMWIPLMMHVELYSRTNLYVGRGNHWMQVFVLPRTGVTARQAEDALAAAGAELSRRYASTNAGRSLSLVPIWKAPFGAASLFRPVLLVLALVVGTVLLIACANVANLFLARGLSRRKEVAIRLAVGGSRWRLVRQLLTESLVLSLLGGAAGLLVVEWASGVLQTLSPPANLPIHMTLQTDRHVLLFALAVSVFTGLLSGLVPALQASNPSLVPSLKDDGGRLSGAPGHARLRGALVVGQVALSLVLLIAAALFVQAMDTAKRIDPGFDPDNVLTASFDLGLTTYSPERGAAFQKELLERIKAIPGVESASYVRRLPLGFTGGSSNAMVIDGYTPKPDEDVVIDVNWIGPGYFRTMRTPVLTGREFQDSDAASGQRYAVINEAMARKYWEGRNPLGTRIRFGGVDCEVVGVVQTGKYMNLSEDPLPYVYIPLAQFYKSDAALLVRGAGDPANYAGPVRRIVREMDPGLALFNVIRLSDYMSVPLFPARMAASFLAVLGILALTLASVGLYSVLSYGIAQRTREIGIRIALGAQRRDVLSLVVRQGMLLTTIGIAIGVAGAAGTTRFARALLYGVNPVDPLTFFCISLVLYLVAAFACVLPAYRASRVDPLVALQG